MESPEKFLRDMKRPEKMEESFKEQLSALNNFVKQQYIASGAKEENIPVITPEVFASTRGEEYEAVSRELPAQKGIRRRKMLQYSGMAVLGAGLGAKAGHMTTVAAVGDKLRDIQSTPEQRAMMTSEEIQRRGEEILRILLPGVVVGGVLGGGLVAAAGVKSNKEWKEIHEFETRKFLDFFTIIFNMQTEEVLKLSDEEIEFKLLQLKRAGCDLPKMMHTFSMQKFGEWQKKYLEDRKREEAHASKMQLDIMKARDEREVFEIGDQKIELKAKEFLPKIDNFPKDRAVLFLPGFSAGGAGTLDTLTQQFAYEAEIPAFSIQTRSAVLDEDFLRREAAAIRAYTRKRGIKKMTIAAHSEGGIKAAELVKLIQDGDSPDEVEGLILLDPVGLYEQDPQHLTKAFIRDSVVNTSEMIRKNAFKNPSLIGKGLSAGTDIIFNAIRELGTSGYAEYKRRLSTEIAQMAVAQPSYAEIKCPVVLITGEDDPVSAPGAIIGDSNQTRLLSERRQILKDGLFPRSPQVDMLVARRYGNHGLPHFRSDQVSKISRYMLERFQRKQHI